MLLLNILFLRENIMMFLILFLMSCGKIDNKKTESARSNNINVNAAASSNTNNSNSTANTTNSTSKANDKRLDINENSNFENLQELNELKKLFDIWHKEVDEDWFGGNKIGGFKINDQKQNYKNYTLVHLYVYLAKGSIVKWPLFKMNNDAFNVIFMSNYDISIEDESGKTALELMLDAIISFENKIYIDKFTYFVRDLLIALKKEDNKCYELAFNILAKKIEAKKINNDNINEVMNLLGYFNPTEYPYRQELQPNSDEFKSRISKFKYKNMSFEEIVNKYIKNK